MYEMGALSYYLTHHAARMDLFEEAAKIYTEMGDRRGLAYPNLYVAQTASDTGEIHLARKLWWESLQQFEQAGDVWYAAMVHSFFGALERRLGNYDESEREFHQAIALYEKTGDQWGRTVMLNHLGMIALYRNDPVKARDWFEQRLRIGRASGFKFSEPYATFLIGITHWKSGNLVEMERCFRQSIPFLHQLGNYATLGDCLIGLAWLAAEESDLEKAAYLLGAVEKVNETYGRKVYFEYDYFNQPLCNDLRSRLEERYQDAIERGARADLDEIVQDVLKK
jgi:tetratricopeptide (TPR) repeat protein